MSATHIIITGWDGGGAAYSVATTVTDKKNFRREKIVHVEREHDPDDAADGPLHDIISVGDSSYLVLNKGHEYLVTIKYGRRKRRASVDASHDYVIARLVGNEKIDSVNVVDGSDVND